MSNYNQDRNKAMRAKKAALTVGNKMNKDNQPHSKAMQVKHHKSKVLMNMLMAPKSNGGS